MRRRFWIDVFEREHMVVFVDFLRGNFAAKDATEEAVWISHRVNCAIHCALNDMHWPKTGAS